MIINRTWAMPSHETFSIPPIKDFVKRYLRNAKVGVDMFSRNRHLVGFTNDLDPATIAESHIDAAAYCAKLAQDSVRVDIALFDPPYSPRQISECYKGVGMGVGMEETQSSFYTKVRDALHPLVKEGGTVLSFGWNSGGMGVTRGYEILEILLVNHGGAHNDTICMAERRMPGTKEMFP